MAGKITPALSAPCLASNTITVVILGPEVPHGPTCRGQTKSGYLERLNVAGEQ